MRGAYLDPKCGLGLVIGTGSNCCYIEQTANFKKTKPAGPDDKLVSNLSG